jgi:hypothetical protein
MAGLSNSGAKRVMSGMQAGVEHHLLMIEATEVGKPA